MVFYQDFLSRERNGEDVLHIFRALNNWATLPNELKRPMPNAIFKWNLNKFLCDLF